MKKIIQTLKVNFLIVFLIIYPIFLLFPIMFILLQVNNHILRILLLALFTVSAILFPLYLNKYYFFPFFKSTTLINDNFNFEYLAVTVSKEMRSLYIKIRLDFIGGERGMESFESIQHVKTIRKILNKFDLFSIDKNDMLTLLIYFHEKSLTKELKDKYKIEIRKHKLEKIYSK